MVLPDVASHVTDVLLEEFGDSIRAVGWYDADEPERFGTVYIAENGPTIDGDAGPVLGGFLRESLAREYEERPHNEQLESSLHVYESLIDIDLPVTRHSGIVVSLTRHDFDLASSVISLTRTVSAVEFGLSL